MKQIWIVGLIVLLISEACAEDCLKQKRYHEKKCEALKKLRGDYVQCVQMRIKRYSTGCEFDKSCSACNCDRCQYSTCSGRCDNCCNSCCNNFVKCHSNHCCHKQCNYECQTFACKSDCRKSCYDTMETENILYHADKSRSSAKSNITTIISLKNVINNTNHLDIPINLNYTNKNNIGFNKSSDVVSSYGTGTIDGSNCCVVIGPRQCIPIQTYPFLRCFHTKSRQCGTICIFNTIPQPIRPNCNTPNNLKPVVDCRQQISSVPQGSPMCTNGLNWPYFSCGMQSTLPCKTCDQQYIRNDGTDTSFGIYNNLDTQPYFNPYYAMNNPYSINPFLNFPQQYFPPEVISEVQPSHQETESSSENTNSTFIHNIASRNSDYKIDISSVSNSTSP